MHRSVVIIPARYSSTRFPGKPLAQICGKSMIVRVVEQAQKCREISQVLVATDDHRVYDHLAERQIPVYMTSQSHESGTERVAALAETLWGSQPPEVIVNVQGDEPFLDPEQIGKLVRMFNNSDVTIATLMKQIGSYEELFNPNIVKVVPSVHNRAIYFSRWPVPFLRDVPESEWALKHQYFKHIGIYAFRGKTLSALSKLQPTKEESAEKLEQLRWLSWRYPVHLEITRYESVGIDTPEDLTKALNKL